MLRIAHLVNPFEAPLSSELSWAQPLTYETMRVARRFAGGEVEVSLLSAQYPEDRPVVPEGFTPTPDLTQSVLDLGTFQERRKLPLLSEVVERLYSGSDAEWLIFSDTDIALMPHFYLTIKELIESGHDALVINRRTVSDEYRRIDQLPLMYALIGAPHEGHDCFVFRRDMYPRFQFHQICLAAPWIGRGFLWNLMHLARSFEELTNHHLTFHLGVSDWEADAHSEYAAHNQREALKVLEWLRAEGAPLEEGRMLRYLTDICYEFPLPEYQPNPWRKAGREVLRRGRAAWAALNGRCTCASRLAGGPGMRAPSVWKAPAE